jgi:hypothetical protein
LIRLDRSPLSRAKRDRMLKLDDTAAFIDTLAGDRA